MTEYETEIRVLGIAVPLFQLFHDFSMQKWNIGGVALMYDVLVSWFLYGSCVTKRLPVRCRTGKFHARWLCFKM